MTIEKTRTGYIVKWVLTNGIIEGVLTENAHSVGMWTLANNRYLYYHEKTDIRWTRDEAISELNKRIASKRKSIEKQLAKLDKLAASPKFTTEAKVWPERKS
jgi:hypothetical protein